MSVVEVLHQLGGVATRGALVARRPRADLERAVLAGDVVRVGRGRYALPALDESVRAAVALSGVLSLTSAALHHGWAVKSVPDRPHVTVGKGRKLDRIAAAAAGPGAPRIRRVAREASPLAANPFESVLRAIALDVPGLAVRPQVVIREPGITARPDLVDPRRRVVLEADSFQWHGGRAALRSDARRYNLLVINGWIVLRFAWEDVMHDPGYVREVLVAATALAELLTEVRPRRRRVA